MKKDAHEAIVNIRWLMVLGSLQSSIDVSIEGKFVCRINILLIDFMSLSTIPVDVYKDSIFYALDECHC